MYKTSSFQFNGNKIVYSDWGDQEAPPIICVHGLTGNGHDFDFIALTLVKDGYRVIAVDLIGRGRSDFSSNALDYNYDTYITHLYALLSHLKLNAVDWLGVSLGGLLGIRLASEKKTPIKRLILNDIGPKVPQAALDFIYHVIKTPYYFDTVQDLEQRMRATRGLSWGPVTDEQWVHMAEHNARTLDDGRITYAYDPSIAKIFECEPIGSVDLWPCWKAITCPTLVIQGGQSLLLTADILNKMKMCGPDYDLVVFDDCGHVPSLMADEQIKAVQAWLNPA